MANTILITQEAAFNRAELVQTDLVTSKLRLCQNFTPTPTTLRADLVAAEATFTGYPSGGYSLAAWTGPGEVSGQPGAIITSPQVIVAPSSGNTTSNNLTAFWVEDSAGTPKVITVGIFNPAIVVVNPVDQFPLTIQTIEGVTG